MTKTILIPAPVRYPNRNIMTLLSRSAPLRIVPVLLSVAISACKKDGGTPAYIQLTPAVVRAANGDTISSKITDLWVYVDDQPAGVWESGRRVPLLGSGTSNVKLIAGVRKDGVTNDRIQYPFYATWSQDLDLIPEQALTVAPVFRYFEGVDIWLQDFEAGFQLDTVDSKTDIVTVPADGSLVGQGDFSGSITLDTQHDVFKCLSAGDPFLVPNGTAAFLEMDYRSDTRMLVGVRYSVSGVPYEASYVYVAPTGTSTGNWAWNKIYIDLASPWGVTGAVEKRFFIRAQLENGATSGHIELDNVKLVRP